LNKNLKNRINDKRFEELKNELKVADIRILGPKEYLGYRMVEKNGKLYIYGEEDTCQDFNEGLNREKEIAQEMKGFGADKYVETMIGDMKSVPVDYKIWNMLKDDWWFFLVNGNKVNLVDFEGGYSLITIRNAATEEKHLITTPKNGEIGRLDNTL